MLVPAGSRASAASLPAARTTDHKTGHPSSSAADINFVSLLLDATDQATGRPYSAARIQMLVTGYIIAAYHTTVITIAWTLYYLTRHPEVQAEVQAELDAVLPSPAIPGRLPPHRYLSDINLLQRIGTTAVPVVRQTPSSQ